MKYVILLFLSFYQIDSAVADEGTEAVKNIKQIEQQLEKMSKLSVFSMKLPPRLVRSLNNPVVVEKSSPLSCDVVMQTNRQEGRMDYNCDAIKTLKEETLSVAAN